ncbi:Hypothetical protein R9X50_00365200 [Acrodontium crateriforme]|uniref:HPP transmembrane region domain-containing protein n=1 Tax=Acrodontium crateriforme TaxID=150365 RepID=A0AAQ3M2X0_9PEZI|nr:Hypothetical protein R9X50_00365200 [Acrodontium crateriforme]
MAQSGFAQHVLHFNPDRYLNPFIPGNQLSRLPRPISHFLGYRPNGSSPEPVPILQWLSAFVATIAGLCAVAAAYTHSPGLDKYQPPVLIASLGATAVLDYNTIRSPLSQPRNAILGHTLSATMGVAVSKLFQLSPHFTAGSDLTWVSAAIGCGAASVVMSMTGTVHPPGGATAVLASSDAGIRALGWTYIAVVLVGALIMNVVALLFNNLFRQYPVYWWTSADLGSKLPVPLQSKALREARKMSKGNKDAEKASAEDEEIDESHGAKLEKKVSSTDSDRTLQRHLSKDDVSSTASDQEDGRLKQGSSYPEIQVNAFGLSIPSHITLSQEEERVLKGLQARLENSQTSD